MYAQIRKRRKLIIGSGCAAILFMVFFLSPGPPETGIKDSAHRHGGHFQAVDQPRDNNHKNGLDFHDAVNESPSKDKNFHVDEHVNQDSDDAREEINASRGELQGGCKTSSCDSVKQAKIKDMIIHAWDGYEANAFGQNEVRPISKTAHHTSIFGGPFFGATLIDSLDTLFIAGLNSRFEKAKEWVTNSFKFEGNYQVSVFECNIRFVGGLLAAHALTGDKIFKQKAVEVASKLLPAFQTPSNIPYSQVNLETRKGRNFGWSSSNSLLSEIGTLSLEFRRLSKISGDSVYAEKIDKILSHLDALPKPDGLYSNYINTMTGHFGARSSTVGGLGDSFYEYLFKNYIQDRSDDRSKRMYDASIQAIIDHMLVTTSKGNIYFAEWNNGRKSNKMDHLACFISGLFAISSHMDDEGERKTTFMKIANGIGETCHLSYNQTKTKLGPESFHFTPTEDAVSQRASHYILRPEVVEAYFYMWRLTKEPKWRKYAWEAVQAIEEHCHAEAGYSGIRNVNEAPASQDDVQQSFFIAETLKYLYLIFSDDDFFPLDKWVFNTEAHMLPIEVGSAK